MLPTLHIGPLALPTHPLLLILGLYLGLWMAAKVGACRGLNPDHLYNAGFYAAIAAFVFGRLGHVIRFFPAYLSDPLSIFSPNLSAFQPLAAVLGVVLVLIWYQWRYQVPWPQLLDALFTGMSLTLAVITFADFLNARNFGDPSILPWAVTQWSVARHPVQLYEMLGALAALGLVWRYLDAFQPGQAALASLGGYAAVRLIVDAFRADPAIIGDGFRLTQVIALVILLLVLLALYQMQTGNDGEAEPAVTLSWEQDQG